jgi:cholesterol transport system auxiliary component
MSALSRRDLGRAAAAFAGLGLAGCAGLIPGTGEAPQIYVLTPKSTFRRDLPKVSWQLLVDVPHAPAEFDTTRIALSRSPTTIDYFANAAWPDRAPMMVQSLLVESFEITGRILAIGRESVGLRADYILKPELRRFLAIYEAPQEPPTVVVRMTVRLVKMPDRTIIAQTTVERRERARFNTMPSIIEAFDEALGGVFKHVIEWTLTTPPPNLAAVSGGDAGA